MPHQVVAQSAARAAQTRLDRSQIDLQRRANLFVAQPVDVVQYEDCALIQRQSVEAHLDLFDELVPQGNRLG